MRLPKRLKRAAMALRVPVQKIWPRHRRWVKSHGCCVPGCHALRVDFAHLRSAANAGKDQTPHDVFGVSLCRTHLETFGTGDGRAMFRNERGGLAVAQQRRARHRGRPAARP